MSEPEITTFTLEEASELLDDVRALVEQLRDAHAVMEDRHDSVMASTPTNGGGEAHQAFLDASRAANEALEALNGMGIAVRDPANGLIDFPTIRDGQLAFLCWKLGEDQIGWWHPTETGFAGRQPL